ncbi:SDR family oxidoreductase [Motilibacter rhizosphaerae]|nr:SDR family oxidoreductase [Motilibacter rhizosphaerae]
MTDEQGPGSRLCLVTGATGYIGGRLVPELLAAGHRVRVLVRDPGKIERYPWAEQVETARGDMADDRSLRAALAGVEVAYYLVHSLGTGRSFETTDRSHALTFAAAARAEHVGRIVYLGGLLPRDEDLSPHLRSRAEVGFILLASGVPTAVLQAAVILGSGSASFEMLRHLTERLPVMVTPKWVNTRIQPIAVRDVLRYLVGAAQLPPEVNRAFDIGGPDVLTYAEMMHRFALVSGLPRRRLLKTPVLSPSLSSHWVGVVTPVPNSIARPLVESLRNTVVCREHDIAQYVPDPPEGLLGFDDAVGLALARVREMSVPTYWSSASMPGAPSDPLPTDPTWAGGDLYVDERERLVRASPEALWRVLEGIGGKRGWYSFPFAWRVRGLMDRLVGGPGLRRGRTDPDDVHVGDALDFWRVEAVEEGELLRLRAEMRLPGLAWLELRVRKAGSGATLFHQRAVFRPQGLSGRLYWWSVWPFHGVIFGEMQRNIAKAAERLERDHDDPSSVDVRALDALGDPRR